MNISPPKQGRGMGSSGNLEVQLLHLEGMSICFAFLGDQLAGQQQELLQE